MEVRKGAIMWDLSGGAIRVLCELGDEDTLLPASSRLFLHTNPTTRKTFDVDEVKSRVLGCCTSCNAEVGLLSTVMRNRSIPVCLCHCE